MATWTSGATATLKMNVNMNADGFIAQSGEDIASTKKPTLKGVSASATPEQATAVYNAFYVTLGGGTTDSLSASRTITQGVVRE